MPRRSRLLPRLLIQSRPRDSASRPGKKRSSLLIAGLCESPRGRPSPSCLPSLPGQNGGDAALLQGHRRFVASTAAATPHEWCNEHTFRKPGLVQTDYCRRLQPESSLASDPTPGGRSAPYSYYISRMSHDSAKQAEGPAMVRNSYCRRQARRVVWQAWKSATRKHFPEPFGTSIHSWK